MCSLGEEPGRTEGSGEGSTCCAQQSRAVCCVSADCTAPSQAPLQGAPTAAPLWAGVIRDDTVEAVGFIGKVEASWLEEIIRTVFKGQSRDGPTWTRRSILWKMVVETG